MINGISGQAAKTAGEGNAVTSVARHLLVQLMTAMFIRVAEFMAHCPIVSKVYCSILRSQSELLTLASSSQMCDPLHQGDCVWLGSDPLLCWINNSGSHCLPEAESLVVTISAWKGQHVVNIILDTGSPTHALLHPPWPTKGSGIIEKQQGKGELTGCGQVSLGRLPVLRWLSSSCEYVTPTLFHFLAQQDEHSAYGKATYLCHHVVIDIYPAAARWLC